MARRGWKNPLTAAVCATTLLAVGTVGAQQQAPAGQAPQGQAPGGAGRGGGGGRGGSGAALFTLADADKDGSITRAEFKSTFDQFGAALDKRFPNWSQASGALTEQQLAGGLNLVFPSGPGSAGGGPQVQTPKPEDVSAMMAALPDKAPATPAKPRKVLVLGKAQGFVHSSIPLAAKTVEALGTKTKAWSTTISYDAADINPANLKQYDAIFLASTTGTFLDDPIDPAATAARKKALLDFVRSGKGLAGIHAASDTYHGNPAASGLEAFGGRPGRGIATQLLAIADKNSDQKMSKEEFAAAADAFFDKVDSDKSGKVAQADFGTRVAAAFPQPQAPAGGGRGAGGPQVNQPLWPEFNKMVGGYFKWHWNNPQHITVKIDDPKSPLTAMFNGQSYEINDETYTYEQDSFSRENVHVLTSVDYSKMSDEDKAKEPAETARKDHDYALSWIRREGQGRVFYEAHGHDEKNYAFKPLLEHVLAGIQYALGDLKADDSPSAKAKPTASK
jgi:type 1 glutamine amidotransferase